MQGKADEKTPAQTQGRDGGVWGECGRCLSGLGALSGVLGDFLGVLQRLPSTEGADGSEATGAGRYSSGTAASPRPGPCLKPRQWLENRGAGLDEGERPMSSGCNLGPAVPERYILLVAEVN
ncbi:hypothetical protein TgHK011_001340 [Trichoderma gracile]|nr:hypothetical protein TgHK011_001340 [Trichoderma gracile]